MTIVGTLHREVLRVLRERGIPGELAAQHGIEYLAPFEHAEIIGDARVTVPGISLPYYGIDGKFTNFVRTKVLGHFRPPKEKKPRRYLQPVGSENQLYFCRGCDWKIIAKDVARPLLITEGEFKAIKACAEGFPCIGLGGVWNWRKGDDDTEDGKPSSVPIDDLNLIEWKGRIVWIVFDADAATKPDVRRAELALAKELFNRGADPRIVRLPPVKGKAKTGLDDWFVARGKRAAKEFRELQAAAASPFVLKTQSSTDLATVKFKDPVYILTDLLPVGLATLNGPPKVRKSFLALAMAHAVAAGGIALGKFQARQGSALFCALEDTPRRMQSRMQMMRLAPTESLHFAYAQDLRRGDDGCEMLVRWCEQHADARLIVIDTLQKFRAPSDGRINIYEADYTALSAIKSVADRFGIAILLVHHLRKGDAADVYERVSGSTAITGTADTNMILLRERTSDDGTLHITGRDIEEQEWALRFASGTWTWIGDAQRVRHTKAQEEVIEAIRAAGAPIGPTEIAAATGRTKGTLPKTLGKMLQDGKLDWVEGGKYAIREPKINPKF